jgi:glycosyltransferase involved in cell wall biosynthesis
VLRAIARVSDVRLDVVGPGPAEYRARLDELVGELGITGRVRFDEVARADLAARYRDADVLVFPSEWEEPFGLVPVEAMACGTPVIASGTGGSAEFLVDGANTLVARPGDVDAWAASISRLAVDPPLREKLARGGLATADALDVDRVADAFEAWHAAAVERFAHGTPVHRAPLIPTRADA